MPVTKEELEALIRSGKTEEIEALFRSGELVLKGDATATFEAIPEHVTKEEFEEARLLRKSEVSKSVAELKAGREELEAVLNELHGRTPKSRPSGSNDPGSQPPPAAPAAARIAGRLDRAVSGKKQAS